MRNILYAAALAAFSNVATAGTVYYLDIVNTASSSIVSLGVARPGSERFHAILVDSKPLQGGGASATVAIRKSEDEGCIRDLRIGFADGRVLTHHDFNICKGVTYHTGRYLVQRDPPALLTKP
jgi:hypothetical protein